MTNTREHIAHQYELLRRNNSKLPKVVPKQTTGNPSVWYFKASIPNKNNQPTMVEEWHPCQYLCAHLFKVKALKTLKGIIEEPWTDLNPHISHNNQKKYISVGTQTCTQTTDFSVQCTIMSEVKQKKKHNGIKRYKQILSTVAGTLNKKHGSSIKWSPAAKRTDQSGRVSFEAKITLIHGNEKFEAYGKHPTSKEAAKASAAKQLLAILHSKLPKEKSWIEPLMKHH